MLLISSLLCTFVRTDFAPKSVTVQHVWFKVFNKFRNLSFHIKRTLCDLWRAVYIFHNIFSTDKNKLSLINWWVIFPKHHISASMVTFWKCINLTSGFTYDKIINVSIYLFSFLLQWSFLSAPERSITLQWHWICVQESRVRRFFFFLIILWYRNALTFPCRRRGGGESAPCSLR